MLHELGHFTAAKAVGMRVERFSLFFPPTLFSVRRGETEYAIGAIPLGGYVKITGMNPEEIGDLEPEVARRAYYNQAPWKRIVVILAGPGVNIADRLRAVLGDARLAAASTAPTTLGNLDPSIQTLRAEHHGRGDRDGRRRPHGAAAPRRSDPRGRRAPRDASTRRSRPIDAHRCAGTPGQRLPCGHAGAAHGPPRRARR